MNPEVLINHEAINTDFDMDVTACFRPWEAREYVTGHRADRIEKRQKTRPELKDYGEITPRCRYFSAELERAYPDAKFVHLVRDPRRAIVSMMNYGYYGVRGRRHRIEAPYPGEWQTHERAAWAWSFGHYRIRSHITEFIRLEDLLMTYATIERLADLIGLRCDRATWESKRKKPVNPSQNFSTEPFESWTKSQQDESLRMLGEEPSHYGY
jgi:hypothetical protein